MKTLFPLTLEGRRVRLEPLQAVHVDALHEAASESREHYRVAFVPDGREAMARYVAAALADAERGLFVPFVTRDLERNRIVGATRFGDIQWWSWSSPPVPPVPSGPDAVEIGWTWLAHAAQHTHVNSEAKLLMLTHAFEAWGVRRVTLKTDARNQRSRSAIQRLGCRLDGVLRAQLPAADGTVRDTATFSMLASEWPEAKARLVERVSRRGTA